ncbi:MAG: DNA translocase FtsK, partial [Clostridia bacterium]
AEEDAAKSELASFFLPRFGEREETEVPVHTEVTDDTQTLGDWHTEDKDTPRIEDELPNVEIAASIQSESAKAVEMDLVELELEPSAALTEEGYEQQESEEWEEEQIAVGEAVEAVEVEGEGVPSETVHLEDEQPVAEGVFHEHEASVSEPDEAIGLPGTTEAHESMEFPDPIEQSVSTAPPLSPVVMSFPIMASPVQAPFGQSGREEKQDHAEEWESKAKEEEAHHSEEQGDLKQAYVLPDETLLTPSPQTTIDDEEYTFEQKRLLEETLSNFNVNATVVGIVKGPSVTRFELQPAPGVKVNKITGLSDDIKLNLSAKDIRIEAPIPGRNAVGIEVPNVKSVPVFISRIIESETFRNHPSPLAIALGMDIGGEPIVADIKKMPHGLIAGSTGSGKSVCINSIIVSLLYKATPEQVRLLLIDPKMVELAPYNHLPHLITPVVTDAKQATASLKWAVEEMERRYAAFVEAGVRDVDRYNQTTDEPLPYIVIIIDELADLMMVAPQDVEDCIIRIAQKARACGIHLLLATQRPSVDVITGNIKANVPTRLAFAVFSQIDSRTILDQSGAERLLGRGDMLFLESGATPIRLQGNFVSDDEIELVTHMIKKQRKPNYLFSKEDLEQSVNSYDAGDDPLYHEALQFVADQGQASASSLQRRFRIGYNRAARLIEMMEAEGHVAGQSGGKPRAVLITREDAQALAEGTTLL